MKASLTTSPVLPVLHGQPLPEVMGQRQECAVGVSVTPILQNTSLGELVAHTYKI